MSEVQPRNVLYSAVAAALVGATIYIYLLATTASRLPPGPTGNPFSGVKNQLPTAEPWKTYYSWSKRFSSSVISFRVYNRVFVVLNDATSVRALLEQRSNIYSDRPFLWMFNVVCARGKAIFNVSSSDPRHRIYRRLLQHGLGTRATRDAWQSMKQETSILLDGFEHTPEKWEEHVKRAASAVITKLAFGYSVKGLDDHFVKIADETSKISGWVSEPGRWLVERVPLIRHLPSFLPGMHWKRQGLLWREKLTHLSDIPHEWVKEQIALGSYEDSFTSCLLVPNHLPSVTDEEEDIIKWCASGLYVGAAHTTIAAITSFVLLMALYPEIQAKAQLEIDLAFADGSFKEYSDIPNPDSIRDLKYLVAIFNEVLRFAPVGNLALPHRVTQDDEYAGYLIPGGATVIPNVWALMHDPQVYPEPYTFSPERFLESETAGDLQNKKQNLQPDPKQFAFGFGKRVCPGIHFAESTLLLTMAGILARFTISHDIVIRPRENQYPVEFTSGFTSHVKPSFPIRLVPRP